MARERFTVLFGMGRGGSTLLWSSDKGVRIKAGFIQTVDLTQHSDCLGAVDLAISSRLFIHADLRQRDLEEGYGLLLHRAQTHTALYQIQRFSKL